MILAAGLGTRLKPFTDKRPKALAMVNNKTLLQRNIKYLQTSGVTEIIINVHHFPDQIKDALDSYHYPEISFKISDESDAVLETGGGLQKAAWFFKGTDEPFVLMNVDVLSDLDIRKMLKHHNQLDALATLAVTGRETSRYFLFDEKEELCGWKNMHSGEEKFSREVAAIHPKAFSGIHIISPRLFSLMKQEGKFSMVDVYLHLAKTEKIAGFDHSSTRFIDVGKPESIRQAEALFAD